MPTTIHIHPTVTSNPAHIAALQLRTGLAAVIGPRGNAQLVDLQQLRMARQQNHDAHVRAWQLASFNAGLHFLQQRLEHRRRQRPATTTERHEHGYQPDPAA